MGRYLLVAVLIRLASSGAAVTLTLLALERTHSTVFGGLLVAATMIPHVLAAPVMGALADRVRNRRAFHAAGLVVNGTSIVACGLLTGHVPAAVVLAIAVVGGCFAPLAFGGLSSTVRDLASTMGVPRRYGLDSASYNIAGISGPALGAGAVALVGPATATVLIGLCATIGGIGVLTFALPVRAEAPASRLALGRGIAAIWRSPSLLAVTTATGLSTLGLGGMTLIAVLIATGRHSPALTGALLSTMAVGALFGSLSAARWPVAVDRADRLVLATITACGAALGLAAVVAWLPLVFALFAVAGFVNGQQGSAVFMIRDREAPEDARTQVFTVAAGFKVTTSAIGVAVAGATAGAGPAALLLAVAGTQFVAAAAGAALRRSPAATPVPATPVPATAAGT